ncbi:hypothetical protein D8Y22_14375 [Salinadaptatus halalkaliphilus]|uniref:DNA primase/polymerase bifunctional N-terminal domain-containing protein n=1 Tax=Salinadaptatus halalkaliphilus TaxID=2419781 RepID=A0A4S3TNI3_9EURY|nr:bifunctional DNA primase/polymerase [Salinadaptatus halalkaliphilus]THE64098.1 hypothetical protein D8Y22_14375 [Salinadaptatus halalkaliphilus]
MSNFETNSENDFAGRETVSKQRIEERLREVGVRVARSVNVENGTKEPHENDHTNPSNQFSPTDIDGNYTVHGGDGLVILDIDVDDLSELPQWLRDLPETFIIETVHGGYHLYYRIEDDGGISNTGSMDWGSIRYDGWVAIGPGSTVNHDTYCKDKCEKIGTDAYTIHTDKPIAALTGDHLDGLRETCTGTSSGRSRSKSEEYSGGKITLPNDEIFDVGNHILCSEVLPKTDQFQKDIMDLLKGGTGRSELQRDESEVIDRSRADSAALMGLYGIFLEYGYEPNEAEDMALQLFKHYNIENPYDKTGNLRKWLQKGESYLTGEGVNWDGVMDGVREDFDIGIWRKWFRSEYDGGWDPEEDEPWKDYDKDGRASDVTLDTIRATMQILTKGRSIEEVERMYRLDLSTTHTNCRQMFTPLGSTSDCDLRQYPTAKEVGELCAELNPERKASYFEEELKKLCRESDEIAHAYCPYRPNGERHVYYLEGLPDPEDARWVKVNGEEREPEPEPNGEETEQKLMTDGGIEARRDLERIREAREGREDQGEEPEVLVCPIDGCDRTVIDSPANLRHHVKQSKDDAHRFRTLNEDLEIEVDEEAYYSQWGPRDQTKPNKPTVKSAAVVSW